MSQARGLFQVQAIELDIIQRTKRVKAINAALEDDAELVAIRESFAAAEERLDDCRKQVSEVENQIESVGEKRKESEERLYSGEVSNTKELQDIQLEVESLTRRLTQLDEQQLHFMMERDAASADHDEKQSALDETTTRFQALQDELTSEKADLKATIESMMGERRAALQQVPEPAVKLYNGMRAAKANRPVSELRDRACTVCGIEQNQLVIAAINRGDQLVRCNSCERILVKL